MSIAPSLTASAIEARRSLLETLPNPSRGPYRVTIETSELTFIGKADQPDFAQLTVSYVPQVVILELKSFKKYVQSFREGLFSYERILNVIFADLAEVLLCKQMTVTLVCRPRGGAQTTVERTWDFGE